MKKITVLYVNIISLLLMHAGVVAQPVSIQVSMSKTSSIVFPQAVKAVDRGSRDIAVQKVPGAENIIQLKALKENFVETNLTVVSAGGCLYSFAVQYSDSPAVWVIYPDTSLSVYEKINQQKPFIKHVRNERYDMGMYLNGIYIAGDILYLQLALENHSNIPYETSLLHFFIRDKKQHKRTAAQELEQSPLFIYGNTGRVEGHCAQTMVVALSRFTIPDKKLFYIQSMEKNGGRHLRIKVSNRKILRAKPLP